MVRWLADCSMALAPSWPLDGSLPTLLDNPNYELMQPSVEQADTNSARSSSGHYASFGMCESFPPRAPHLPHIPDHVTTESLDLEHGGAPPPPTPHFKLVFPQPPFTLPTRHPSIITFCSPLVANISFLCTWASFVPSISSQNPSSARVGTLWPIVGGIASFWAYSASLYIRMKYPRPGEDPPELRYFPSSLSMFSAITVSCISVPPCFRSSPGCLVQAVLVFTAKLPGSRIIQRPWTLRSLKDYRHQPLELLAFKWPRTRALILSLEWNFYVFLG